MPLFMDMHYVPGAVLDDVVEAHKMDVAIQEQFECHCMTFWFDKARGNAFCLIEAPDKESVINMHKEAHGLVPFEIIEVNSNLVHAFLGRLNDPEMLQDMSQSDLRTFYQDPAFRILLIVDSLDYKLLKMKVGSDRASELKNLQHDLVHEQVRRFDGHEIELSGRGRVISFISASQAADCAISILKHLHVAADELGLKIGLTAGVPVNRSENLFGIPIQYARDLCLFVDGSKVIISDVVTNLLKEKRHILVQKEYINLVSHKEDTFLRKLSECLFQHWKDASFNAKDLATGLLVSRSQLYRKVTSITGKSPIVLLRHYRLTRSLSLLTSSTDHISEIARLSGFNSSSYFAKCFQQKYGCKPSAYIKL